MWTERYTYVKVSTSIVLIRYYINQEILTLLITMFRWIQSSKDKDELFELPSAGNHVNSHSLLISSSARENPHTATTCVRMAKYPSENSDLGVS